MSTQLEAWCGHLCRIKANTGAIVRATHELDSPVVGELKCGVNVRVWESGFSKGKDGKTWTGRCKVMHPHEGWISAKTLHLLPQGINGRPVPRANDLDANFEMIPVKVEKQEGPPKTFVPASIKVVILRLPEDEKNGPTKFNAGLAHGQSTLTTEREARTNNELYGWVKDKHGLKKQDEVMTAMFQAYFSDEKFLGDRGVLVAAAETAGLSGDDARAPPCPLSLCRLLPT